MNQNIANDSFEAPFYALLCIANEIARSTPGVDILVLEKDDEMRGYASTPLETRFSEATEKVLESLDSEHINKLISNPELIAYVISTLVKVQPATAAYRSRMYRFATDWGSEISYVAADSRRLLVKLRAILSSTTEEVRSQIAAKLDPNICSSSFRTYYWVEWDQHGEETVRIDKLLESPKD